MRVRIEPGPTLSGATSVPGDKSIAHRWLILAATARGRSRIAGLPSSLDIRSTAGCLAQLSPKARPALDAWALEVAAQQKAHGSTWNLTSTDAVPPGLEVEGEGRDELAAPSRALDCGNSGTAMRLLAGTVAAAPFRCELVGDASLSARPMQRVAEPLRLMGATVHTTGDHAPLVVEGGPLRGIRYSTRTPSAQVKGAVLLAGLTAEGETTVEESAPTRDHTERVLAALGAPVRVEGDAVTVGRFQHGGIEATVPGDPSSAAFLIAAAALTGSDLEIERVGLNPSRTRFLEVMSRMGVRTQMEVEGEELAEPVGTIRVRGSGDLAGTRVGPDELPLVIDEVPVLALLAAHARGETSFLGAGELRVKESDRLAGLAEGIRAMGGDSGAEGDDLVVAGFGLRGGTADARGDHRLAMAFAVASLAAGEPCEIDGMEAAEVSFPGFVDALRALGASIEVVS
ncbi:MAG: 3-phosphoshikimate 1-carboxyvinyltransferase [Actinobacteria bacterium]|nr:3-phosphoshikimate 1-carboxyvinyltransferase [Actinomycetota bacterium]